MYSSGQENIPTSPTPTKGPVKYGELIVLGCNGSLHNGDKGKRKSRFALYRRNKSNGVKPSTVHTSCTPQAAKAISSKEKHSISFTMSLAQTVVVEYAHDVITDMFQIGRSTENPIDFVVTDMVPGGQTNGDSQTFQSTISRFACRIICQRNPPYKARIYAAGFDSSRNIFLGEKAAKWTMQDSQMDGLTTNGILVMHPRSGFCQDSTPGLWREISVCGNVFTLRDTRSSQQRGKMHGLQTGIHRQHTYLTLRTADLDRLTFKFAQTANSPHSDERMDRQPPGFSNRWRNRPVDSESNELVDGSLIDLCGATLLWRTAEGLAHTPTVKHLEALRQELNAGRPQCPVGFNTLAFPSLRRKDVVDEKQPWAYLRCGHVHGYHAWGGRREPQVEDKGQERECPMCRTRGPYVPLWLGCEAGFYVDAGPPTHAFVPCGHVCSEKTTMYWRQILMPHGTHTFHAACPFCIHPLNAESSCVKLIFQSPLD